MSALIRYEAARHALAVAKQVDEVKDIRDKAQALAAYARQAKDEDLIRWASEIKLRAERRCGEILAETEKARGGRPAKTPAATAGVSTPTVKDAGLSYHQAADFQAIAAVPEEKFEAEIAAGKATTASLVRASPKKKAAAPKPAASKPKPPSDTVPKDEHDKLVEEYNALRENRDDIAAELEAVEALRSDEHVVKIKQLQAELRACRRSRDTLMAQVADMTKQLQSYKRRLDKATAK